MKIPLIGIRLGLPAIVYLVIGAFVAQGHRYYAHVNALKPVIALATMRFCIW